MAVINGLKPIESEERIARWAQRGIDWLQEGEALGVFATENLTTTANAQGGTLTMVDTTDGSTVPWPATLLARAQAAYTIAQQAGAWGRQPITQGGKSPLQMLQGLVRTSGR